MNSVKLEKKLQNILIDEPWRLREAGYNFRILESELTLKDGSGRLDLLCRDWDVNNLVVVELKVVPATVKTYEQITKYMDSIKKTRNSGKPVNGLVIRAIRNKNCNQ